MSSLNRLKKKGIPSAAQARAIPTLSTENLEFIPCDDLVLLEIVKSGDATDSGIVIPESAQESMLPRWRVIAVGPGRRDNGTLVPVRAQVGDEVMCGPERGSMFQVPGCVKKTVLVEESAILAVVRERRALQ